MSRATPEDVKQLIQRFGPLDTNDICWGNSTYNVLKIDTILDQERVSCDQWPRIYQASVDNPYQGWGERYDSHDYVVFEGKVFNQGVTWYDGAYQDFDLEELRKYGLAEEVTAKRLFQVGLKEYRTSMRFPLILFDGEEYKPIIARLVEEQSMDLQTVVRAARRHLVYLRGEALQQPPPPPREPLTTEKFQDLLAQAFSDAFKELKDESFGRE